MHTSSSCRHSNCTSVPLRFSSSRNRCSTPPACLTRHQGVLQTESKISLNRHATRDVKTRVGSEPTSDPSPSEFPPSDIPNEAQSSPPPASDPSPSEVPPSDILNEPPSSAPSVQYSLYDILAAVATRLVDAFPFIVLAWSAMALWKPQSMGWFRKDFLSPGIGLIMLGMGATLTLEDLANVLKFPLRISLGCLLQYTVMPAMGLLVSRAMNLSTPYAVGVCLVACCPGGTASNVVTYLAGADVPLSVMMTTCSTLLAVVTTPFLTQMLVGTLVQVDAQALLMSTLQVVLVPVVLGAAMNRKFPRQMSALAPFSALVAVLMVGAVCATVMAQNAAAVLTAGPQLLASVFTLHAGGFLFGYLLSRVCGMPEKVARTNSIEVGMQNSALGAFLATQHFPDPLTPIPCVISACMHSMLGSFLAAAWRSMDERKAKLESA